MRVGEVPEVSAPLRSERLLDHGSAPGDRGGDHLVDLRGRFHDVVERHAPEPAALRIDARVGPGGRDGIQAQRRALPQVELDPLFGKEPGIRFAGDVGGG